jgi:hypothetical protein
MKRIGDDGNTFISYFQFTMVRTAFFLKQNQTKTLEDENG